MMLTKFVSKFTYIHLLKIILTVLLLNNFTNNAVNAQQSIKSVDVRRTKVYGPGLEPDKFILPVRYFFIEPIDGHGKKFNASLPEKFAISIAGTSVQGRCRYRIEQIDRRDGTYIIRYKIPYTCEKVEIHILYKGIPVAESPYRATGLVYSDKCYCPEPNIDRWLQNMKCSKRYEQIENDLKPFQSVNLTKTRAKMLEKYNLPGSVSLCNYVIRDNRIYRKCYGQYTGFKMFMDAILDSLRKWVELPDTEFFINLGDWPLVKKGGQSRTHGPYPIFSWSGSDDTFDIVFPTYDITESSLEAMNRVTLDLLSVQEAKWIWTEKQQKAFWRGRDARRERLKLMDIARQHEHLFNVSFTNFFFFRDEEEKYGPKVAHMSFFDFFEYKYQINIDGTVAAYRLPYLLAGNSVVFKQQSPFYEHFYKQLKPMQHYIPFKRDLSDLVEKINWAIDHDKEALKISKNAQAFVNNELLPHHIFCYHVQLLNEWTKRLVSDIRILPEMEELPLPEITQDCKCQRFASQYGIKDEL